MQRQYKFKGKYKNNRQTCDGLGAGGTPLREELAEALGAVRLVVAACEPLTSQRPEDTVWLSLLLKISKFQRFNYFHWIGVYSKRHRFQIVCGVHLDNWISALLGNAQQRKRSTIGRERHMAYGWPSSPIFSGVRSCLR